MITVNKEAIQKWEEAFNSAYRDNLAEYKYHSRVYWIRRRLYNFENRNVTPLFQDVDGFFDLNSMERKVERYSSRLSALQDFHCQLITVKNDLAISFTVTDATFKILREYLID